MFWKLKGKSIIFTLCFVFLFSFFNINRSLATDKHVNILSPLSNSVQEEGNILLSVKITEPKNLKIRIFEIQKKQPEKVENHKFDENTNKDLKKEKTVKLSEKDMNQIVEKKYTELDRLVYLKVGEEESFTNKNKLSFYTKKLEDFKVGVYVIDLVTVSSDGKEVDKTRSYMSVVPKKEEKEIFENESKGAPTFFQNLFKTIFGN